MQDFLIARRMHLKLGNIEARRDSNLVVATFLDRVTSLLKHEKPGDCGLKNLTHNLESAVHMNRGLEPSVAWMGGVGELLWVLLVAELQRN